MLWLINNKLPVLILYYFYTTNKLKIKRGKNNIIEHYLQYEMENVITFNSVIKLESESESEWALLYVYTFEEFVFVTEASTVQQNEWQNKKKN